MSWTDEDFLTLTESQAASITLFTISIILAIARTCIRLRYQKRLFADDVFLLVAVICLCAALTLLVIFAPSMYLIEAFITSAPTIELPPDPLQQQALEQKLFNYLKLSDVYYIMSWTTIFAVKFSFLFFFRVLIWRVRGITLYWRIVGGVSVLAWGYCISGAFIICPYFDIRACKSPVQPYCANSLAEKATSSMRSGIGTSKGTWNCFFKCSLRHYHRHIKSVHIFFRPGLFLSISLRSLLTVMVIPIYLLWHVQIKFSQKLALGVSLCLSIMMVILAIVRISRFRSPDATIDFTWDIFWQFAEACVAVTMVSLTAFRSLFIATQRDSKKRSYSSRKYLWGAKKCHDYEANEAGSQEMQGLPKIPPPALTGMRTLIQGERTLSRSGFLRSKSSNDSEEPWPLRNEAGARGIRVQQSVSLDTEVVGFIYPVSLKYLRWLGNANDDFLKQISHATQRPEYRDFV